MTVKDIESKLVYIVIVAVAGFVWDLYTSQNAINSDMTTHIAVSEERHVALKTSVAKDLEYIKEGVEDLKKWRGEDQARMNKLIEALAK